MKKIEKLNTLKGQLIKIEEELEYLLTDEEFFDLCETTSTVNAYIKLGIKKIKNDNSN